MSARKETRTPSPLRGHRALELRSSPPESPGSARATRANYQAASLLKRDLRELSAAQVSLPVRNPDEISLGSSDTGTGHTGRTSEMSKPVLFYGKSSQLDDVLTFATVKIISDGVIDEKAKAGILASLLRGPALSWLTNKLKTTPTILDEYDELAAQLKESFGLNDRAEQAQASRALANCRQKGSVQDYALRFTQLAEKSGIPEPTALALFTKGLKNNVRTAIIMGDDRDSLEAAIAEATRIDTELFYANPGYSRGRGKQSGRDHKGRFKSTKSVKNEQDY